MNNGVQAQQQQLVAPNVNNNFAQPAAAANFQRYPSPQVMLMEQMMRANVPFNNNNNNMNNGMSHSLQQQQQQQQPPPMQGVGGMVNPQMQQQLAWQQQQQLFLQQQQQQQQLQWQQGAFQSAPWNHLRGPGGN